MDPLTEDFVDDLMDIETIDLNDPMFDLDEPNFDRGTFNPCTPVQTINYDLSKYHNRFTVAHVNARSLVKSIEELREIIYKTNFDAIAISETWLTKNSPHHRFDLDNYTVFRNDRKTKRGEGFFGTSGIITKPKLSKPFPLRKFLK